MNVELAMGSLEDAKARPQQFNMEYWVVTAADAEHAEEDDYKYERIPVPDDHVPPCGTTCCYAGFVAFRVAPAGCVIQDSIIHFADGTKTEVSPFARDALEITAEQASAIFLYLSEIEEVERAVTYLAANPNACFDCIIEAGIGTSTELVGCGS